MGNIKKHLEGKGYSRETTDGYYLNIIQFIIWTEDENIEPEQATYNEILSYIGYLKKREIKQNTIQCYLNSLKHYFSWLNKEQVREDNPVININIKGIKRNYLYEIISRKELETLYNNYEIPPEESPDKNQNWYKTAILASKRNKVILGLLIYQGLSAHDLGIITVKDVKLREGKIYVPGSRRSNERELNLEAHQVLDIMEYTLKIREEILQQANKTSDKLIVSTGRSEEIHSVLHKLIIKLNKQYPKITGVKQIRASVITHWLKNYNLRVVQYMAGHRYVSSTENYLINDFEDLQEEINKYHPLK